MITHENARWRLAGFAMSAGGSMLFAIKGVLIKLIYAHHVDAVTLLALRMVIALPVFVGIGLIGWRRTPIERRPDRRSLGLAALIGVLGYYVSSLLDFQGLVTLEAQTERLILFTYPFLVILFGRLLLNHPVRFHALAGAGLSYAGLILMFASDPSRLTTAMLSGAALVGCSAVTFALYQLYAREMILRCGPSLFTAVALSSAGVSVITHFLLTHNAGSISLPAQAWALIVALAIFATILPTFLMSAGTARIGAQGTAIIGTISPAVTIALAVAVLGEPFGLPEAMGTMMVMGGVGLFSLIESRKPSA